MDDAGFDWRYAEMGKAPSVLLVPKQGCRIELGKALGGVLEEVGWGIESQWVLTNHKRHMCLDVGYLSLE